MSEPSSEAVRPLLGLPKHLRPIKPIGAGSQKRVYLAVDQRTNEEIALFCFEKRNDFGLDIARLQELNALSRIGEHPHVLKLLDVFEANDEIVLCVPYLPRGDLAQHLAFPGTLPIRIEQALTIGAQLADAIAHVHKHGLIHGDIKAENVLLADDGSVRLADFGLAHLGRVPAMAKLAGTLTHLSPERIRGEEADERSDIYSFGCLLYELFCGRPPFLGGTPAELLNLHVMARPRALQSRRVDVPLVVAQLVDRMLEKQPSSRPKSAAEVSSALAAAARTHAFVASRNAVDVNLPSRSPIRAQLHQLASEARSGASRFVVVTGELGAGKTEVLRTLARDCMSLGFGVCMGRAEDPGSVPYAPVVEALSALAGDLPDLEISHATRLREFLYLSEGQEPFGPIERGVTQERLFASIFAALETVSQRRPTLLVLEDLHHADSATLDLIDYFEYATSTRDQTTGLDLLIVVSCRSDDIPASVEAILERRSAKSVATCVELDVLDERDIRSVLETHGVESVARSLAQDIRNVATGNLLDVMEIVRYVVREDMLEIRAGEAVLRNPLTTAAIPMNAHGLIEKRLADLSTSCRAILDVASIIGMELDRGWLEAVARSLNLIDVRSALDEAIAAGIMVEYGTRVQFRHPLMRESLRRKMPSDERARVHLRIVSEIRALDTRSEERRDLEVARHLISAGENADRNEVVTYATRAGQLAMARFAWAEAARYFAAAIKALPWPGASGQRARLHHQSGLALFRLLDAKPCLWHLDRAAAQYSELADWEQVAKVAIDRMRAVTWMGMVGAPEFQASRASIERTLQYESSSPSSRALRAESLCALAEFCWAQNDPSESEAYALEALAQTRPDADHLLRAEINITLGLAQLRKLRLRDAVATWRFGALHGRRADDLSTTARCLQRVELALFHSGQLEEAKDLSGEVSSMNRVLRLPGEAAVTHAIAASMCVFEGDNDRAEKEAEEGLEQLSRARYPWGLLLIVPTLACSRAIAGNADKALTALEMLIDTPVSFATRSALEAFVDRHRALVDYFVGGRSNLVSGRRQELVDQLSHAEPDEISLYHACLALEIATADQDPELATVALPFVDHALDQGWLLSTGWSFFLPRLAGAGRILVGDIPNATSQLLRAMAQPITRSLCFERGRTHFDLARALVLSHDTSDREAALAHAHVAVDCLSCAQHSSFYERAVGLVSYLES